MGDVAGLVERLEKATGPDREIDARLDHATRRAGIVWGRGDDFLARWPISGH